MMGYVTQAGCSATADGMYDVSGPSHSSSLHIKYLSFFSAPDGVEADYNGR